MESPGGSSTNSINGEFVQISPQGKRQKIAREIIPGGLSSGGLSSGGSSSTNSLNGEFVQISPQGNRPKHGREIVIPGGMIVHDDDDDVTIGDDDYLIRPTTPGLSPSRPSTPLLDRSLSPSPRSSLSHLRQQKVYLEQQQQTQQLKAYVAWVNSQLKKRPGCRLVEDLRRDMQDGVSLVHLVEIVSGESLAGVDFNPQTTTIMRENVERVLQFMAAKRIRMHHTASKDIVDGNLKAIMRLILALAAHYKPSSVKQSGHHGKPVERTPSAAAVAANVAAGLRDIRNDLANAGQTPRRYREHHHRDHQKTEQRHSHSSSHSSQSSPQLGTPMNTPTRPPRSRDRIGYSDYINHSAGSSPNVSVHHSPASSPSVSLRQSPSSSPRVSVHSSPNLTSLAGGGQNHGIASGQNLGTASGQHLGIPGGQNLGIASGQNLGVHGGQHLGITGGYPQTKPPLDRRRTPLNTPVSTPISTPVPNQMFDNLSYSSVKAEDSDQGSIFDDKSSQCSSSSFWNDLQEEQNDLAKELEDTKKMVVTLQDLLLNGQVPEGGASDAEEDQNPFEGTNPKEQLVVVQARLDQCQSECNEVKSQLAKSKQDSRNLQGVKAGLQSRLTEQDNSLLQLKAELLRLGFTQQNLEAENAELKRKLEEKSRTISDMTRQLHQKDKLLTDQQIQIEEVTRQLQELNILKNELQNEVQQRDDTTSTLETQLRDLSDRLGNVGISESTLVNKITMQDRMMEKLEGKILQTTDISFTHHHHHHPTEVGEELQVVRDALRNLRSSFSGHDPQHHNIDALEQSIAALVSRVRGNQSRRNSDSSSTESVSRHHGYSQDRDPRRSPITSLHMSGGFGGISPYTNGPSSVPCTKVLYFTERTVTPFMSSIPKRLGEITLRDFREIYDRQGNYRYHFKALDPEFGTVKEEITNDDDIVPGWEGKIVAWIEEDTG